MDGVPQGVIGAPRLLLRAEGFALLAAGTAAYAWLGGSWWLYGLLFFAPDLGFLGYLGGPRAGAFLYNSLHTTLGPAGLAGIALAFGATGAQTGAGMGTGDALLLCIAATWAAHIGFDRMLGYGLKYDAGFGATHLGRLGRADAVA